MQKIRLFHWFIQEIWLIAIWLAENILAHISGTKIFPNMESVQEQSKYYKCSLSKNSVKDNDIFFNKSKKTVFGPFLVHFPYLGGKKNFSGKSGSATHNFIWVSSTMSKFRKANDEIPRKRPDRRNDRRTSGRTDEPYFPGPFQLPPGGQKFVFHKGGIHHYYYH